MTSSPPASGWRKSLVTLCTLAVLVLLALWAWRQPVAAQARMLWTLSRMPAPTALPMPVEGVRARQVADTFGAPRGQDRRHAGVDIFAKAGTPVRATTPGIVVAISDRGLGGRQVWVLGPARERHYYAHLRDWAPGLKEGDIVAPGTPLGSVGNTGNARTTPPHLHYGVYAADGARDPLPLLRATH
ncbi:M23 family metallopeptidase [Stenotrophomonas sp. HITSZ_GD]|uniref:M23 family metallopeptidase n=1 Tax=Stenotrophomonas sp. HITSZ_GD TaxID=3037248 RepID=UPI00240CE846|nr:M23 family metallopeptidase [Stenotrophomonas sp. HITSZ_GD]MDG2525544.1 M23 family metallopeptidase [Stenotrophomonas sp. HITSZ_GD]